MPAATKKPDKSYDAYKEKQAAISRERSAAGRDVGRIPDIKDIARRERCIKSLKLFAETYNAENFYLSWSKGLLRAIARIEEAAFHGALYALAFERGGGKTAICRTAAWWMLVNGIKRYPYIVGATDQKACEAVDTLKKLMRFKQEFAEDFPEIAVPIRHLAGIPNKANGQTCGGESTLIRWSTNQIVLPTVRPPENWPKDWKLRSDGMVPTSGSIVTAAGLLSEGIRGTSETLATGEMIRPDFVLLDDPQTTESAGSETQNSARLTVIMSDVLGMCGPGKELSAVMPCTVIEQGDLADVILDRKKNPLWRGERSGILSKMPENKADWDTYFEIYEHCAQLEPPDFTESNDYYRDHQALLEGDIEASWEERKKPYEVSAIQHAMHIYCRDPIGFMAEFMNSPQSALSEEAITLRADDLRAKVTNVPAGIVPRGATRLTGFIDPGGDLVWWAVCAFDERFGGGPIAFGVYPDQKRSDFAKADPRPGIKDLPLPAGQKSQDASLWAAMTEVVNLVVGRTWIQEETGAQLRVERCLVDANWGEKSSLMYDFCRRSPHATILTPSHGKFYGATSKPMANDKRKDGERRGPGFIHSIHGQGTHVTFDTNFWKSFAADRFLALPGSAGCWYLPAPTRMTELFAKHLSSEYAIEAEVKTSGRRVAEWKRRMNRDNDWWDCVVGCAVAASMLGVTWAAGMQPEPKKKRVVVSMKELAEAAAKKNTGAAPPVPEFMRGMP